MPLQLKLLRKGVLIDTFPLLIHAVGSYDKKLLNKVSDPRLCVDEFEGIDSLFLKVKRVFVTPYVLCELSGHIENKLRFKDEKLKEFIDEYKEMLLRFKEIKVPKEKIISSESRKFGFVDASLVIASEEEDIPILMQDRDLAGWCEKNELDVIRLHDDLVFGAG